MANYKPDDESFAYNAFLTHNWSKDELGQNNHERVSRINTHLKGMGVKTWFDSERMSGQIQKRMTEGINDSEVMVVFITKTYHEKVNGDNDQDNCQFEFKYGLLVNHVKQMVVVVMEEGMKDQSKWRGLIGGNLGHELYVAGWDASEEEIAVAICQEVCKRSPSLEATLNSDYLQIEGTGTEETNVDGVLTMPTISRQSFANGTSSLLVGGWADAERRSKRHYLALGLLLCLAIIAAVATPLLVFQKQTPAAAANATTLFGDATASSSGCEALSGIVTIDGSLTINGVKEGCLDTLKVIKGDLKIRDTVVSSEILVPALKIIEGSIDVLTDYDAPFSNFSAPILEQIGVDLKWRSRAAVSLPRLLSVNRSLLFLNSGGNLLSFPKLQSVHGDITVDGVWVEKLSFAALEAANDIMIGNKNGKLHLISFPSLISVNGKFEATTCYSIPNFKVRAVNLQSVGSIRVGNCNGALSFSAPNLRCVKDGNPLCDCSEPSKSDFAAAAAAWESGAC